VNNLESGATPNDLFEGPIGALVFEKRDMILAITQVKQLTTSLREAVL